jgi:ubiquinone/menaquinone biosynthesis C-methylase UbiE
VEEVPVDRREPSDALSEPGAYYFDFLARAGLTKHLGSMDSTRELAALCRIEPGQLVLDVGCGVGATPCYLARTYGCRVVGVDITPGMIAHARERAWREGLEGRVAFHVADARALPYREGCFDVVLCESVLLFFAEKQRAVDEFARAAKPGGMVALNESTLLRPAPSPEFMAYLSQAAGAVDGLPSEGDWARLLHEAGLSVIAARSQRLDLRREARGRLERYSARDMGAVLWRIVRMVISDPGSRAFLQHALTGTRYLTQDILDYMGYGVYVGRA